MSEFRPPSTLRVAPAIARVTFFEVIRDKVLYNIIVCAALVFMLGFLASRLSFIRPERITLDFGMSAVNLSCAMIAMLAGAGLIGREFERRTIHVALSHPISRAQFVLGKFLGLAAVVALNWALLCVADTLLLWSSGAELSLLITPALVIGWVLLLMQAWAVGAIAVLFSTFSTTSLSVIMTLGLYLIGSNISEIRGVAERMESPAGKSTLKIVAAVLPNFEHFNVGNRVTYGLPLEAAFVATAFVYGIALIAFTLLAAGFLIRRREV